MELTYQSMALAVVVILLSILVGWAVRASLAHHDYIDGYRVGLRQAGKLNPIQKNDRSS